MIDLSNQNRISARVLYLLAIIGLELMLAIATPGSLLAHANLSTADPAPNSVLDDPPERVAIRFTEPLEAKLSEIRVLNSQAQRVDNDDHSLDVNDSHVLWVTLKPMENGTYTVAWKNVSTVDGHLVRGSYIFSVGEPLQAGAVSLAVDETLFQSPAEPIIRWLVLLGALTAVGGLAFELLVTRPSLRQVVALPGAQDFGDSLQSRTHWLIWASLALLLIASIAQATMQAVAVFESSVFGALGDPLKSIVTETGWGRIWLWRVILLALMAVAFGASVRISDPKRRLMLRILAAIIGLALLWTLSLASHAAATTGLRLEAMINDFLHLVAVAAWVGGLFYLVQATPLALRLPDEGTRRDLLGAIVPRFSMIAAVSVAVLIVTGIFSAWAQVTALPAMAVPYGSALVAKLVVVALLLILGAINLLWVKPRLGQPGNAAVWLKRLVIGEVALAILAMLSTGFLTGLEPARQVASREGIGVEDLSSFEDTVEGADITVNVEPGQIGPNTVTVDLKDRFGNPITNATDVFVRLTYLDADLGEEPDPAVSNGDGQWTLSGGLLSIAGAWRVEVLVTRPDAFWRRTGERCHIPQGEDRHDVPGSRIGAGWIHRLGNRNHQRRVVHSQGCDDHGAWDSGGNGRNRSNIQHPVLRPGRRAARTKSHPSHIGVGGYRPSGLQ
jgi:copper transport protein